MNKIKIIKYDSEEETYLLDLISNKYHISLDVFFYLTKDIDKKLNIYAFY